jgi:hypothetical protein
MAQPGHRHQLVLYTHLLNRWWRNVLGIGIVLVSLVVGLSYLPGAASWVEKSTLQVVGSVGAFSILLAIFLVTIRKSAYVQPFDNHLRLVTPFLRLKISYRRIRQTSSVEIGRLFSLKRPSRRRAILRSLKASTAIILDLNGLPLPRPALLMFLSPLFFPDKSPRIALFVPDWMEFSTELESYRSAWIDSQRQTGKDPRRALLSSMSKPKG